MNHRPFLIPKNFDKKKSFIGTFTLQDLIFPFLLAGFSALMIMILISNELITFSTLVAIILATAIPITIYIILLLPYKKTNLNIKRYITDWIKFISKLQFYFRKNSFDLIPDKETTNEPDVEA